MKLYKLLQNTHMNAVIIGIYSSNTLSSVYKSNGFIVWPLCGNNKLHM